jgi:tRNA 5-methylaminomethyl-2-thiouridine biosynthesis bifunctional protein
MKPAPITWHKGTPHSELFDDFYFNSKQSLEDSLYVYYDANQIAERMHTHTNPTFTIAETGFGTGLNFLLTAQKWLKSNHQKQHLHFISVEKHPISYADLKRSTESWPELTTLSTELLSQYPQLSVGFHRLSFANNQITLTLMFGDAVDCYQSLNAKVDAWYLDGFSPTKNPDMWSDELFETVANLSHSDTTFSTFTSAGVVRRGLQKAGFIVNKRKGFGLKREMLIGTFTDTDKNRPNKAPWFNLPTTAKPAEVTIIGAGLAGATTAYALANRGIKVNILEVSNAPATGGSGNRQGALYAKLPIKPTKQGQLHLSGFLYSLNLLKKLDPTHKLWSQCGVIQLATSKKEATRQNELISGQYYPSSLLQLKTAEELTEIAGSKICHDGLFFPDAGWVSPVVFCKKLLSHPNIEVEYNFNANSINRHKDRWEISSDTDEVRQTSHLIICSAEKANQYQQCENLPLKKIRGQVSITPPINRSTTLESVVCGDGYISPAQDNQYCFGATFDLRSKELNITSEDHHYNLQKLGEVLPSIANQVKPLFNELDGRTAFRCSTPDYMPIVGPIADEPYYQKTFAKLAQDKNWPFKDTPAKHHEHLYINTGHGSKGLITCPIAAELLASQLCLEPLPLPTSVVDALNPCRFIVKDLIRNKEKPIKPA